MKIRILDRAERDLEDGVRFYERQGAGLGRYFFQSVAEDIGSLARLGGIHRRVFGHHQLLCRRFPYAVYHEIEGDIVSVNAVVDCRRNPVWVRRRLAH